MLEYNLLLFSGSDLKHKKRQIMMHSELDVRPVQIITGHVIYNSPYKYWLADNGQVNTKQRLQPSKFLLSSGSVANTL